jgi:hypothetical protein
MRSDSSPNMLMLDSISLNLSSLSLSLMFLLKVRWIFSEGVGPQIN